MRPTLGFAAEDAHSPLKPFRFARRAPGPEDVVIEIRYCGICHSDIHQARGEWGRSSYPMVPGHEIAGTVSETGSAVTRFAIGDRVGVGCFVDSCRVCPSCRDGLEQFCEGHLSLTYNGLEQDLETPTFGGYSSQIVVDQNYVLRIPDAIPLDRAAPLLCAGITTYSPMREFGLDPGQRLGVLGLGGLGHMAVKLGASLGAEVTVFSSSRAKEKDARRLGASDFKTTSEEAGMAGLEGRFDMILDTVSAAHDLNACFRLLRRDGTLVILGGPTEPLPVSAFALTGRRRRLVGSLIGGIRETQEALDHCGVHRIGADVEVIPIHDLNTAFDRVVAGDVRYRFVIDMTTLAGS